MDNHLLDSYINKRHSRFNFRKLVTKVLIVIIILLVSLIYTSFSDENLSNFKKYVFEDSFNFSKINSFYKKLSWKGESKSTAVSKSIDLDTPVPYLEGSSFDVGSLYPVKAISSGIVVFIGEKEGYNKTIIIQGSDGYDIWYGNIENENIKIYDYISKDTIIGDADKKLYIVIQKDGKYIKYEDYQSKV